MIYENNNVYNNIVLTSLLVEIKQTLLQETISCTIMKLQFRSNIVTLSFKKPYL